MYLIIHTKNHIFFLNQMYIYFFLIINETLNLKFKKKKKKIMYQIKKKTEDGYDE